MAVQLSTMHIAPLEGAISVDQMINVGSRKKPSKESIDRFLEVYLEIVRNLNGKKIEKLDLRKECST